MLQSEKSIMQGAYILDDYYFFFDDPKPLKGSRNKYWGTFVCPSNREAGVFIRMKLLYFIDYGSEKAPPMSRIDVDYKTKQCTLVFSEQDFLDWFINCDDHVRDNGPSWRSGGANVYIKTIYSKSFQTFRNDIISYMMNAPEPDRLNHEKIRSLKLKRRR